MPFMGGMEATELIRAYETEHQLDRTPIIALTAHASKSKMQCLDLDSNTTSAVIGDRERCLQAGMDDHITSMSIHWPIRHPLTKVLRTLASCGSLECDHQTSRQRTRSYRPLLSPPRFGY